MSLCMRPDLSFIGVECVHQMKERFLYEKQLYGTGIYP